MRPDRSAQVPLVYWSALGVCLALLGGAGAAPEPADPVGALLPPLNALRALDPNRTDPDRFKALAAQLEKRIDALKTPSDMTSALFVLETSNFFNLEAARIIQDLRGKVLTRFGKKVEEVTARGPAERQAALARLLADLAVERRHPENQGEVIGPPAARRAASSFVEEALSGQAPHLISLTGSDDEEVSALAARALGLVEPEPKAAAAALGRLLDAKQPARRRAAAAALADLVVAQREKFQSRVFVVEEADQKATAVCREALPVARKGFVDADPQTRALSLGALREAGRMLERMTPEPWPVDRMPPDDPRAAEYFKLRVGQRKGLVELGGLVNEEAAAAIKSLDHTDAATRTAAAEALEAVARARRAVRRDAEAFPEAVRKDAGKVLDDPLSALPTAVKPLAAALTHKEPAVRVAAVHALEFFEADAAPAAEALVNALADEDAFVRWGAVRTLGRMAPLEAARAVRGLAGRLTDPVEDVRITAATALARFGAEAREAVADLRNAAKGDDVRLRVLALQALAAIGPGAKAAAVEAAAALGAEEVEVRRSAARALRRFGSPDKATAAALRQALHDADAVVRRAAADALLAEE
jgi:HEAT repeat protein